MALTEVWLKTNNGKPRERVEEFSDRDSMSVRISMRGKIVFQLRYRIAGKGQRLDIGTYPNISLKDARVKAQEFRVMLDEGKNPKKEVMLEQEKYNSEKTLIELFDLWFTEYYEPKVTKSHEIRRTFEIYVFPSKAKAPANRMSLHDWLVIIEPLAKTKPSVAGRILSVSKQMLKWAVKRQHIDKNVLVDLYAKSDLGIEKQKTSRVLSDSELKVILEALRDSTMTLKNKIFVELCLIYGCRNGELRRAKKTDFDFEKMIWTVPVEHNKIGKKTGRDIVRPILPDTEKLIKQAFAFNKTNHFILAKDNEIPSPQFALHFPKNLMLWVGRNKELTMKHWSMHDLRRTARTNFSSMTTRDIAEIMVGHVLPSIQGTYDYYDYLDEQKEAYQKWIDKLQVLKSEIQ